MTGFLGAGKTTVINQLLATKPADERWALLINEFGRIGIDGALLASEKATNSDIAIREVSGGCICCTSQLPLQIAIGRLLSDHRPQRLLIEPTGLAHPRELVQQLSAPHWQTALKMQAVITVLSGVQWQQDKYRTHAGYRAHVCDADVLVINRYAQLKDSDTQALQAWIAKLNATAKVVWATSDSSVVTEHTTPYLSELTTQLHQPSHTIAKQSLAAMAQPRVSLTPPNRLMTRPVVNTPDTIDSDDINDIDKSTIDNALPYRYHDTQQDMALAGWRLPPQWIFAADDLQQWLLQWPNWQRIKGVVHTSDGWLTINFTPDSLTSSNTHAQVDSRLEIILQLDNNEDVHDQETATKRSTTAVKNQPVLVPDIDWDAYDHELMALVIE